MTLAFLSNSALAALPKRLHSGQTSRSKTDLAGEDSDGSHRKFVVEQRGKILILPNDQGTTNTVFLDARGSCRMSNEEDCSVSRSTRSSKPTESSTLLLAAKSRRSVVSEFPARCKSNQVDSPPNVFCSSKPFRTTTGAAHFSDPTVFST